MTDEAKEYDLSQVFTLGKPRKKIIYCNRACISERKSDDQIDLLITKSFNANRYYKSISFNRHDSKWNCPSLDAFEITVCTLKPKKYNTDLYKNILCEMKYNDLVKSVHTLGNNALTILDSRCDSVFPYALERLYKQSRDGLFVVLNNPVKFIDEYSKEPAITQYAAIDIYNSFLRKSIETTLNDSGLVDKDEDGYYRNEITVNATNNNLHIKKRLNDDFVKNLKQKIFNTILGEICEYNNGAIEKFLRSNNIEVYGFADQLFNKFKMDNQTFYFDLNVKREENNDTM